MPPRRPAPDEAEQLRELIREAHEVIKDLKVELRSAKAFIREIVEDVMTEQVTTGLAEYGDTLQTAIRLSEKHIKDEFDELFSHYMATTGPKKRLTLRELMDVRKAIEQIEEEAAKMVREGVSITENDPVPTPIPGRRVHAITVDKLPSFVEPLGHTGMVGGE